MSIYVGDKKAKLYRGDYGPAQFYKGDVKIAGYTDGGKVGTQIGGVDTYNDALLPTIEGNSEQTVTAQGKNLLDSLAYTRTTRDFKIAVSAGDYIQTTFNGNDLSTGGIIVGTTYSSRFLDANKATVLSQIQSGVHVTEEQAKIITTLRVNWADAYYTGTSPTIVSQLEVGKTRTPYEPFVPNSPSPDYPSPIRSSENFDVVSCGRNLCDNGEVLVSDYMEYLVKKLNIPSKLKTQISYTIQIKIKFPAGKRIALYCDGGWHGLKFFISTGDWQIITTTVTTPANLSHSNAGFELYNYPNDSCASVASFEFGVVYEGIYTAETLPQYQPYHATTAHVPDPLRSVGDVHDTIEVSEGKVEVVKRVVRHAVTSSSAIREHTYIYHNGYTHFSQYPRLGVLSDKVLCNLLPYRRFSWSTQTECISCSSDTIYPTFSNIPLGIFDADTPEQKVSKLKSWLDTHEMHVDVLPEKPTRTDITATPLGQALLAMRTYPHYTQVYTNATLPPTLRARIKEMDKSGSVDM